MFRLYQIWKYLKAYNKSIFNITMSQFNIVLKIDPYFYSTDRKYLIQILWYPRYSFILLLPMSTSILLPIFLNPYILNNDFFKLIDLILRWWYITLTLQVGMKYSLQVTVELCAQFLNCEMYWMYLIKCWELPNLVVWGRKNQSKTFASSLSVCYVEISIPKNGSVWSEDSICLTGRGLKTKSRGKKCLPECSMQSPDQRLTTCCLNVTHEIPRGCDQLYTCSLPPSMANRCWYSREWERLTSKFNWAY